MNINKKAIIIAGVPCSGKTTLCNKLSKKLKISCINETNSENLNGILNKIDNANEFVIIEHSDILNYIDKINKIFNEVIIIYLDVSDELLIYNYNERIKNNSTGDFKNLDIIKIKKELKIFIKEENFKNINFIKINTKIDYINSYNVILRLITKII